MEILLMLQAVLPDVNIAGAGAITALIPVLVPFVVYSVKLIIPSIPRVILPLIAVGGGLVINALDSFIAGADPNVIVGALLGAAGVFLREVFNTFQNHGLNS